MTVVLDASALLALLFDESGADEVLSTLVERPLMSTVNFAEVLTKLSDQGVAVDAAMEELRSSGVLNSVVLVPFDREQAEAAAAIRIESRALGLSVGDRACLALAMRRKAEALTADRAWLAVRAVKVRSIR